MPVQIVQAVVMALGGQAAFPTESWGAEIVAAEEVEHASLGFHRAHPSRSAKRVLYVTQGVFGLAIIATIGWAFVSWPNIAWTVLHISAWVLFAIVIAWRLVAASNLQPILWRLAAPSPFPVYTILCPLRGEANVVADLIEALERLDYPAAALDVKFLIEADDPETLGAIRALAPIGIDVLVVPALGPRTKPKALNVGLARARGQFVVVYDAEDRPHPQQLRAALAAFEDGGPTLACVQAPLRIDNAGASWIAQQFATEYAIQFREILPLLARLNLPLPLGGSSNHFRTDALRAVGGWDPFNVTEDADLGYRLAREGYRANVIGPPTSEEAPVSFSAWLKQRARWIKGHLQTWLVLMRNPWRTAAEMGGWGFLSMQLTLGAGLVATFVHGPLAFILFVAAVTPYDLLTTADFVLALCGYCVAVFAALTACALSGNLRHAGAAPTMPFYWPLSTIAAVIALRDIFIRPHHWSKTAHGASQRPPLT